MRCEQFERRLHQALDRREGPTEDPRLVRHARRCRACRQTFVSCQRLLAGLDLLELPVPGDDFPLQVVRRIEESRLAAAAKRIHRKAWAAMAVGLSLALLVSLAWHLPRSGSVAQPDSPAGQPFAPATASGAGSGRLVWRNPQQPRGDEADSVPRANTASSTSLAIDHRPPLALLRVWTESWSDRWNPVDGLTDGLTPIVTPLGVAVEEIRRTIPLGQAEAPQTPSPDSVRKDVRHQTQPIA